MSWCGFLWASQFGFHFFLICRFKSFAEFRKFSAIIFFLNTFSASHLFVSFLYPDDLSVRSFITVAQVFEVLFFWLLLFYVHWLFLLAGVEHLLSECCVLLNYSFPGPLAGTAANKYVCALSYFQVAHSFSSQSGLRDTERKPRQLATVLFLGPWVP